MYDIRILKIMKLTESAVESFCIRNKHTNNHITRDQAACSGFSNYFTVLTSLRAGSD